MLTKQHFNAICVLLREAAKWQAGAAKPYVLPLLVLVVVHLVHLHRETRLKFALYLSVIMICHLYKYNVLYVQLHYKYNLTEVT